MIDLGNLNLESPVAGKYTVTFTAKDAAGNVATQTLNITINPKPEYEEKTVLLLDFEDGAGSGSYVDSHWKQEKFTTEWVGMSGQMNSRVFSPSGSKVVNIVGGYSMTNKFTYTPDATLEKVVKVSITVGNYFSNAQTAPIKFAAVTENGQVVYFLGSSDSFTNVDATPNTPAMVKLDFTLNTPANIKSFYLVFKSAAKESVYFYLDDITFVGLVEKKATDATINFADNKMAADVQNYTLTPEILADFINEQSFGLVESVADMNKVYGHYNKQEDKGIKFGTSSVDGTFTLNLSKKVTKVEVVACGWVAADKMSINGVESGEFGKAYTEENALSTYTFEFEAPTDVLVFLFQHRGFIQSMKLYFE